MTYPKDAVNQAFALLPTKMDSRQARIVHAAIGYQESRYDHRRQIITVAREGKKVNVPEGPAMGFWQFESGGGVKGVMHHASTSALAKQVCAARNVAFEQDAIWKALQVDDVLAAAFARLLMWTDSSPLPFSESGAWHMYIRTWRPGKPHIASWPDAWKYAHKVVTA